MSAVMNDVLIPHDYAVVIMGVCSICGNQHTNMLHDQPYDLCASCETWWLNQQGDTQ